MSSRRASVKLWSYEREGLGRGASLRTGEGSLKWQRLKPYEKFAEIDRPSLGRHRRLLPVRRIRYRLDLSKGSTIRSGSFSVVPTGFAMKSTCGSRFSPACCQRYSCASGLPRNFVCQLTTHEQGSALPPTHVSASLAMDMMDNAKRVAHMPTATINRSR